MKDLDSWRESFGTFSVDPTLMPESGKIEKVLNELTQRLKGNYPFHHPRYAGQMLKPSHHVAWLAYAMAMSINPNNHALDGGPPTSEMEKEVMKELADMVGFREDYLGHLTAGGTMANLEALWVARQIHPDKGIAYSTSAHYTHGRMCEVLGIEGIAIPGSLDGHWDMNVLKSHVKNIGTVVLTLGTTGLGMVEYLEELWPFCREHDIRIHVDAAYGGFFSLLKHSGILRSDPWDLVSQSDSIVIDPHKHGLQPYGCGSVLFRDPGVGRYYKHDSPYTYFTSNDLHLGEISLECSRAGAAAAALWTTLKLFPLKEKAGLGPVLRRCLEASRLFYDKLEKSDRYEPLLRPELDIVAYYPKTGAMTTSSISARSQSIFKSGMDAAEKGYFLSLYRISSQELVRQNGEITVDSGDAVVLRSVLMKPEHLTFVPELISLLEDHWEKSAN